jgi:hypothetical protein
MNEQLMSVNIERQFSHTVGEYWNEPASINADNRHQTAGALLQEGQGWARNCKPLSVA